MAIDRSRQSWHRRIPFHLRSLKRVQISVCERDGRTVREMKLDIISWAEGLGDKMCELSRPICILRIRIRLKAVSCFLFSLNSSASGNTFIVTGNGCSSREWNSCYWPEFNEYIRNKAGSVLLNNFILKIFCNKFKQCGLLLFCQSSERSFLSLQGWKLWKQLQLQHVYDGSSVHVVQQVGWDKWHDNLMVRISQFVQSLGWMMPHDISCPMMIH